MTACGLPVAVQVKLTSSPDMTIVFVGSSVICGGTAEIGQITKPHSIIHTIVCSTQSYSIP